VNGTRGTLRFLRCATVLVALAHPAFSQLSISPGSLPGDIVNQSYFAGLSINNAGATFWTWTISGALPPGIGLVPAPNAAPSASLTGTPTAVGVYSFTVLATENIFTAVVTVSQSYTIQVAGVLSVTTSGLAQGTVGTQYSQQLQATGGVPPYTWSLGTFDMSGAHPVPAVRFRRERTKPEAAPISSGLPPGLLLSSSGQITGTPTQIGSYTFSVIVSDSSSSAPQSTGATFTIDVIGVSPLLISTTSPLANGALGVPYSIPLRAQGGEIPYTWTLASGTIPPGLQVGSGGSLTGTPTQAGNYSFTLTVSDFSGLTASATFTITIASAFSITTPSPLPAGTVGVLYSTQINVTPTTGPYTFSVAAGSALPAGLSLNPASTTPASILSGTPTAAGSFTFTIIAADSANHTASQSYTLVIALPPITITPTTLPNGTLGTAYSQQLTATGGAGGYVFGVGSGALPGGLTLSSAGLLSGTPTAAGAFSFTVSVTDSKQTTVAQTYQLTINNAPVSTPTVTGVGSTAPPAQQPAISVQLGQPYPTDLTGTITLTFAPAAGNVDDPSIQFSTGGRSVTFTIPAGQTTAVFSAATISLGTGTVAGTITLTLHFSVANGLDVTPNPAPTQIITITPEAPVITKVATTSTSSGIEVDVTGFSNTREMVSATFTFQAASGTTLQGGTQTITVGPLFATWYGDATSDQYGSQFTFAQTFNISGSASGVASVSVTLANSIGTSTAISASVP
jgi:hypothetical protein